MKNWAAASYSVRVIDSGTVPALVDTVILRATGNFDGAEAEIEAYLVPERYRPFEFALFGDTSVSMRNAACTDSYNSDSGSYAATVDYLGASVGSNGTLSLENIAMIGGDAVSAIEDGITLDNKSTVRGDTVTGVDPKVMDIVPDSDYVWAQLNSDVYTGMSGTYTYDPSDYSLDVGVNEVLTLSSGVYYFSDITLGQNAIINLEPGAEVTIYMTGDLVLGQSSEFNEFGTPSQVQIYSTGSLLELGQSTILSACFYGPEADFILRNYTNFYGSVVADYIAFEDNVCFHYDRILSELEKWETGKMLVVAWREI